MPTVELMTHMKIELFFLTELAAAAHARTAKHKEQIQHKKYNLIQSRKTETVKELRHYCPCTHKHGQVMILSGVCISKIVY